MTLWRWLARPLIDPLGHTTTSVLDGNGATVESIDGNGNLTQTAFDGAGNVLTVTDSVGNQTHYVTNALGESTVTTNPLGYATTSVYDAAGRVSSVTDGDGRVINYVYDAGSRLTGEVWLSSAGVMLNVQTFTYDKNGNLLTAQDQNGTVSYTYDSLNRQQSYTNIFGQVLTYAYNANDQVTQRSDSLGGVLTYVYDNAQRLTSEQFAGTGPIGTAVRVDFGYNARNDQTGITWFSNLAGTATIAHSAYNQDNADRLRDITNTNSAGTVLSAYTYTYDAGNRVSSQQHWSQVGTTVYSGTNSYTYDANNQLLSDGTITYSYDSNGNRTMTGDQTGGNNQLTNDGTYTYTYDNVGNQVEKSMGTGQQTWYYTYDNENHLLSARETSDGTTNIAWTTFTYDATGAMASMQTWATGGTATTTRFLLDGTNVIADLDGSNNLQARYLYGPGTNQILARAVASGPNAGESEYFTDYQESVTELANSSGVVTDHISYTGYGVATESNASVGDRFKYDGYAFMVTVGWDYCGARWYNPTTGTWNTVDPDSFGAGQPNLYDYVSNNPTNATDPSGLQVSPDQGSGVLLPWLSSKLGQGWMTKGALEVARAAGIAAPQMQAPAPNTTTPTLSFTQGPIQGGVYGGFLDPITWKVKTNTGGIIVQRIAHNWSGVALTAPVTTKSGSTYDKGTVLPPFAGNGVDATKDKTYYEAWFVNKDGTVAGFSLSAIQNLSAFTSGLMKEADLNLSTDTGTYNDVICAGTYRRGTYQKFFAGTRKITATAIFLPGLTETDLTAAGFVAGKVKSVGQLFSTYNPNPGTKVMQAFAPFYFVGPPEPGTKQPSYLTRTISVSWSPADKGKTNVTAQTSNPSQ